MIFAKKDKGEEEEEKKAFLVFEMHVTAHNKVCGLSWVTRS